MRIDRLTIQNFKGFEKRTLEFPRPVDAKVDDGSFHVLIGDNGTGKTSALDALAVALGIWHVATPKDRWRNIAPEEIRVIERRSGDTSRFEPAPIALIAAAGEIAGTKTYWRRASGGGRTTDLNDDAVGLIKGLVAEPGDVALPVLVHYGAGRAWLPTRERKKERKPNMAKRSRFDAYYYCLDGRIRDRELNEWFLWEKLAAMETGKERAGYLAVTRAVLDCIPGATALRFDVDRKEIVVTLGEASVPFYNLSDGQRSTVALVADLAIKAVLLNPHFGDEAARRSPGVVLIDELDLHLHPTWQRRIVEDLRRNFPAIQFVATTHSPFIVQSMRPGELIPLDGQPLHDYENLGIETIARSMGVSRPDVSARYSSMVEAAKDYLLTLEEAAMAPDEKLAEYERRLAERIAPYADNPAFQAFLELKHEGRLGERARRLGLAQPEGREE